MRLYQVTLIALAVLWSVLAIKTMINRPNDIFEEEEESSIDDNGLEYSTSKTPLTNAWIMTISMGLFVGALYVIIHIVPWNKIILI